MANVSIGLAHDLMVIILISKVVVKIRISAFTTYTYKRQHGIRDDLLARKWGIFIDREKRKLQSKTQNNVISDLKPLTWQYRMDFLPQRLHRLN